MIMGFLAGAIEFDPALFINETPPFWWSQYDPTCHEIKFPLLNCLAQFYVDMQMLPIQQIQLTRHSVFKQLLHM